LHAASISTGPARGVQTLGSLAPRTDVFLLALKHAMDDRDPKVFRAALTHLVSSPDQASLHLAGKLLLQDSSAKQRERQLAVLRVIEQAGTSAMVPVLQALIRHHLFRFWSWRKTRALRSSAARALAAIRKREDERTAGHSHSASPERLRDSPADEDPDTSSESPTEDSRTETAHVGPQEPV